MRAFRLFFLGVCLALSACASKNDTDPLPDAPEGRSAVSFVVIDAPSYAEVSAAWKTPEDINAWIGARFSYDTERALRLSESRRAQAGSVAIYEPEAFFRAPVGVCVDLSRFAVETLQRIRPELRARYLMLEFAPTTVRGAILRRHWVAVFQRDGAYYMFADSKRPGHMAGPYPDLGVLVAEYAQYRKRPVLSFQERESYQKSRKRQPL